jgi:ferrous iron transport protein B
VLLINLFVPDHHFWIFNLQGLVMACMYLLGFVMALLVAWVLKKVMKGGKAGHFVTELPLYRSPRWKNVGLVMLNKARTFVWEAGKVILVVSVLLWVLLTYGPPKQMEAIHQTYGPQIEAAKGDSLLHASLNNQQRSLLLEASYAGHLGKAIEPVIKPLGFDWKIGISILASFAAREIFVGTMATIYSDGEEAAEDEKGRYAALREKMQQEVYAETGQKVYTPVVALSLLIFYVFAMQCMSTLAVTRKETGSWKMTFLMLGYLTGLAYLSSLLIYQVLG